LESKSILGDARKYDVGAGGAILRRRKNEEGKGLAVRGTFVRRVELDM
jgi:hypothetical protein